MVDVDSSAGARAGPQPLFERIFAFMETTAIMAAAEIGLADPLAGGPRTAAEVAEELGADERAVGRLLRDLTGTGVIETAGPGRFALGPQGQFLRSDVSQSARALYRMFSGPLGRGMLGGEAALVKGATAFEEIFGAAIFDYMADNPRDAGVFNTAMVDMGMTVGTPPIHAYDFSGVSRLVDVGGGHGQLAREVLRRYPEMEGVVYDRPGVIAETRTEIDRDGLGDRCEALAGDFFESVPPGGDCYALRYIIHDWDDEAAATILRRCREAITPEGRLLLFEIVMPEGDGLHPAKGMDWVMLACVSGQERTEAEHAALLDRAGFRLTRVVPSSSPMSVVEAVPVERRQAR
jgi:hypothetical protein